MMARKTKLTPERHKKIVDLLTVGNYAITAIKAAGINQDTYYEWLKRGQNDKEKGRSSVYADFSEAVATAEARAEADMVLLVKNSAIQGNAQSAQWFLERKHADRWGRNDKLRQEITGPNGSPLVGEGAKTSVLAFLESRRDEPEAKED